MMRLIAALGVVALTAACSVTEQAKPSALETTPTSGFLGDYSQLKPGGKDRALLVYVDPSARWREYKAVFVQPVQFWGGAKVEPEQQQNLSNYYYNKIREHVSTQLPLADTPGPGVLEVRAALTDTTTATPVLRTVSVVVPQARLLNSVKNLATGSYAFVGVAQSEMEVRDGGTGRRLAAAVDRRSGGLSIRNADVWEWGDAENAMDYWSERVAQRLGELRSGAMTSER
jgi:hypothetical protein